MRNYKSHIRHKRKLCRISRHFIEDCIDVSLSNLKFVIVDAVNNSANLTENELEDLLLAKEKFWIGTLITQHKGMNGSHDWNRTKRTERENFSN